MKISLLINNYNYGQFLGRAIESALVQTPAPNEIILVDDGSTDNSMEVVHAWAARDGRIKAITKPNGGQLSAFNAGLQNASGDVICFLDADDEFRPGYLARLVEVYQQNPQVDFVFCQCEVIGGNNGSSAPWEKAGGSFDFGLTLCRTYLLRQWLGSSTSCISARRSLLSNFLPCALENDWRIRADDVLVYGASLFLGRKYYLAEKWVRYHSHGNNNWLNHIASLKDPVNKFRHQVRMSRLFHHWTGGFDPTLDCNKDAGAAIVREFRTIPNPSSNDRRLYLRMIWKFSRRRRIKQSLRIWKHWRKVRRKKNP